MSHGDAGKSDTSAPHRFGIARVETKLGSIQERMKLLQSSFKDCKTQEQRQFLQAELAFLKTRKMICQKHKGMLMKAMEQQRASESRSSYGNILMSGAMKLFQRWAASLPESTSEEECLIHPIDSVEGEIALQPTTPKTTLRKRNPSNPSL